MGDGLFISAMNHFFRNARLRLPNWNSTDGNSNGFNITASGMDSSVDAATSER